MVVKNDGSIEVNLDNKNKLHTISTDMIKNIDIKAAIAQPLNGADQPTIKGIHGLRKSKDNKWKGSIHMNIKLSSGFLQN